MCKTAKYINNYDVFLVGGSRFIPNGSDRNEYLQKGGKVLVDLVEFWSTSDLPFSISNELNTSKIRPINVRFTAAWEPGQSDVAISKQKRSQPMRRHVKRTHVCFAYVFSMAGDLKVFFI